MPIVLVAMHNTKASRETDLLLNEMVRKGPCSCGCYCSNCAFFPHPLPPHTTSRSPKHVDNAAPFVSVDGAYCVIKHVARSGHGCLSTVNGYLTGVTDKYIHYKGELFGSPEEYNKKWGSAQIPCVV